MHWYKRNIGDYAKKAGRLSMLQHGAYTLLIDACYDREQFPTRDDAIDWTWASSSAEIEAVEFVLAKFFTLIDGRYVQHRISEELGNYHATSEINKRIAIDREAKRQESLTKRARSVNGAPPNQEPVTKNQEPVTKEEAPRKRDAVPACPPDVDQQTWSDWLKLRKTKKAPVTETVIRSAISEAEKAGMTLEQFLQVWCARGSQGLEASWLNNGRRESASGVPSMETFSERDERLAKEKWQRITGKVHPDLAGGLPPHLDFIEAEPFLRISE